MSKCEPRGAWLRPTELRARYLSDRLTPTALITEVSSRLQDSHPAVWIDRLGDAELAARAAELEAVAGGPERLPLYGIPFAVKDNIDVAGRVTTAACPAFAYAAASSAAAVSALEAAGAVLVGKTNLDQFATGLVGTRSPYGTPVNPHAPDHIPGGSSCGSAVAVAAGLVSFALGTDTAGSGRIPAAMTGTVGLKPTRGIISTVGVVPACRSLDCVSVFAPTADDAASIYTALQAFDPEDAWARRPGDRRLRPADVVSSLRVGVPVIDDVDDALQVGFAEHVRRLSALGLERVPIDLEPLERAGKLLYDGPWLAERLAGIEPFLTEYSDEVLDVTRQVLTGGRRFSAVDVFDAMDELAMLRRRTEGMFAAVDLIALPSVPTLTTLQQVADDPLGANARLGRFANFVNLLDLAAIAVPAGRVDGVPIGITLCGPALTDATLLAVARAFESATVAAHAPTMTSCSAEAVREDSRAADDAEAAAAPVPSRGQALLAVVGAHLRGQPLHHELVAAEARLVARTHTAPAYRLYDLADPRTPRPGLVPAAAGEPIAVEVYELNPTHIELFNARATPPLSVGTIRLADGSDVAGYVCDPTVLDGLVDISHHGGWREYLATASAPPY